jgi:hypothetical protein
MKANTTWNVLPHGPLEKVTENVWRVQGSLKRLPIGRVMTVVKRSDDSLIVHNASALEEESVQEIDAWGPVRMLIVPSRRHRLDAPVYKARYSDALVVCPAGARDAVEEVVSVDRTYDDVAPDADVELITLDGVAEREGAMMVRSADGVTLVLNEVVFNLPHTGGLTGFILRYITHSSGGPRVGPLVRWLIVKDKGAFRAHLERLAATPDLRRLIVSHVDMISDGAALALHAAADTVR